VAPQESIKKVYVPVQNEGLFEYKVAKWNLQNDEYVVSAEFRSFLLRQEMITYYTYAYGEPLYHGVYFLTMDKERNCSFSPRYHC
jgi:hypothetical protein